MGEKCENRGAGVRKIEFVEDRGNLMLCSPSHPATVLPTPDACFAMPSTHKKVIVRKMDRDSVSGYVSPAQIVSEGKVEVLNTSGTVISVDLREIKGVYFVREFGEAESLTRKTFTSRPRAEGLWVRLRFKDSEVLEGLMPADLLQSTPEGYLVNPPDQRSNTQRIFVPRTALESLTVLAVIGTTRRQRRAAEDQRQVPMFEE
ncbi:MAG: hypothetical protein LAP86_02530 [Acidobacteriia bacterium]|nr:hypothetical protein [Terriglobia bacterium]